MLTIGLVVFKKKLTASIKLLTVDTRRMKTNSNVTFISERLRWPKKNILQLMQSCYPIVNKFNTSLILPSLFSLPASCRRWSLLTLAFCRRWSSLLTLPLSVMSSSMVSTLILLDLAGGLSFCCWIETNITFCKLIFFIFQHDWAFNSV